MGISRVLGEYKHMTKRILILLLGLALMLSACQGANQPVQNTVAVVVQETATQVQAAPASAVAPTTTVEPSQPVTTQPAAPPGCTVVSPQPTAGPTEQSLFPPVSDSDWVQGLATAYVTITEYGDFQ
jgi:hypothetical protein